MAGCCASHVGEDTEDLAYVECANRILLSIKTIQICEVRADTIISRPVAMSLRRSALTGVGGPWAQLARDASLAAQASPRYTLASTVHQWQNCRTCIMSEKSHFELQK
ncbi:hypothetical protein FE257_003377 [Aspergillus nanangensis]|uniref:Uncharacterized protein n=1 Tax=Aspergillus nanangensis TaxID=2582783 RepID=A0AAD4GMX1_ASPNN|nr:hypothetical protein FE257_003377 [Aspergillus nanangensis]